MWWIQTRSTTSRGRVVCLVFQVYWLKNGKRVEAQTFPHIIIDDYNRLIIEQVELQDEGNYTCVADTLGMEQRYSTAEVTVLRKS